MYRLRSCVHFGVYYAIYKCPSRMGWGCCLHFGVRVCIFAHDNKLVKSPGFSNPKILKFQSMEALCLSRWQWHLPIPLWD